MSNTAFIEGRFEPDNFSRPAIDIFEHFRPNSNLVIHIETDEFSAVCPATENPDMYDLKVIYGPIKDCIELKSFKMYLKAYRNWGIFIEDLAPMILNDIVEQCNPDHCSVELRQGRRGGIDTTVYVEYNMDKDED